MCLLNWVLGSDALSTSVSMNAARVRAGEENAGQADHWGRTMPTRSKRGHNRRAYADLWPPKPSIPI